jgi:hypothetical protein
MKKAFIYVVDRDLGFAPNPFHGYCTLATCKPGIRKSAQINDWVIGMGGTRLNATNKCIYAMRVDQKLSFNQYWNNPLYKDKKPIRNGTRRMLVGDNIYHQDPTTLAWCQADSHHSNADGSINNYNVSNDTQSNNVLISANFFYFGQVAPVVPCEILAGFGYKNGRNYRVFDLDKCQELFSWIYFNFSDSINLMVAKPFDFDRSHLRYSVETNIMTD